MKKLHEKIMALHFRRAAKVLAALALAAVLVGGGASAALLAPQINEAVAYAQAADETERAQAVTEAARQTDGEHGKEKHRDGHDALREWENLSFSEPSTAAKAAVCATALLLFALCAAYWLLCAAWLYRAAFLSGMSSRFWLVLALLGNLAAIALFFTARWALRTKCPRCGTWQRKEHFCAKCGAELIHYCPSCGKAVLPKDLFCQRCGAKLHAENQ